MCTPPVGSPGTIICLIGTSLVDETSLVGCNHKHDTMSKRAHSGGSGGRSKSTKLSSSKRKWIARVSSSKTGNPLRNVRMLYVSCVRDKENKSFDEMMAWLTTWHEAKFPPDAQALPSSSSSSSSAVEASAHASLEAELASLRAETKQSKSSASDTKAFQRLHSQHSGTGQSMTLITIGMQECVCVFVCVSTSSHAHVIIHTNS
jgi:hypothetical protein